MQFTIGRRLLGVIWLVLLPLALFAFFPVQAQVTVPTGTYIRVEAGAAFHQNVTFADTDPGAANCDLCGAQFPSSIAGSVILGGALGYRINPSFRTDLSINYISDATVSGHSTAAIPSIASAKADSLLGLFNGYIDLPPTNVFGPIQPYVDAGIGIARNQLGTTSGNSGAVGPFALEGASRTDFAWALGAGVECPLTSHLSLDAAYRFLDIGELRTDSTLSYGGMSTSVTPSRTQGADVDLVTIGLRYEF